MEEIEEKDSNSVNIVQNAECPLKEECILEEHVVLNSHIEKDAPQEDTNLKIQNVNNEFPHKKSEIPTSICSDEVTLESISLEPSLVFTSKSAATFDHSLEESHETVNVIDAAIVNDEINNSLDAVTSNDTIAHILSTKPEVVTASLQALPESTLLSNVDSSTLTSTAANSTDQDTIKVIHMKTDTLEDDEKSANPNESGQQENNPHPIREPSPKPNPTPPPSPIAASLKIHQPSPIPDPTPPPTLPDSSETYNRLQGQLKSYETEIEQLKMALSQKENTITLYQRENALLEKEKSAFRKEKEIAMKEKESIVITFATKEKSLIDAKKQKDLIEKQLAESRKEVKNISTKFHALNEEKSRITYMLDEKCNEIKKYQKELEKQKSDYSNLEMKIKWNSVRLAQETEAKLMAEKKLEEERNNPKPHEEQAKEKIKMEYEATAILLKHEIENKDKTIETLTKEQKHATEKINQLQESLSKEILENTSLSRELECLRQEHAVVQNSYSDEMLNSAKLRGQLEELQILRTQNTLNDEKISTLNASLRELEDKMLDSSQDLEQLQAKEQELLSINKEMSEMIVGLQNEICLQTSRVKGIEAENEILKKEKQDFDMKNQEMELQLKREIQQKNDDRLLLTKHLSEKTKLYESVKVKLENAQGDLDATKKKHSQVVKELQREIQKFKRISEENTSPSSPTTKGFCRNCQSSYQERLASNHSRAESNNSRSGSESEAQSTTSTMNREVQGPSKQHLVERILRLQQASARQTEKIDFLENHTLSLVAELQKKSKVVQYYMMRDQAGALTSSKSDHNKTELAKYGGVMSAIYSGIKGPNQSMTLELSLEINKKLQAVLEDTLLKNITLKENLDVLGLEVDKLTRKLAQVPS